MTEWFRRWRTARVQRLEREAAAALYDVDAEYARSLGDAPRLNGYELAELTSALQPGSIIALPAGWSVREVA